MRQDYIEPDYVDGVYDKNGNQVIRPLNEEEKQFLNSFYEEVVGANFMHDPELRRLHKEMKPLKSKKRLSKEEKAELEELKAEYFRKADEVLLYSDEEDQRRLYGENNARNRCLYNRAKSAKILNELDDQTYDEYHNNVYNNPNNSDELLMSKIEPRLKTILRKKKKKEED